MTENTYRILVVDDDDDINTLISTIMKKENYEVVSAFSGTEAKLLIKMYRFSLILLDLMIPGISGEELIKELRKSYNLPIIVLTAKGSLEDKVNVLSLGADDYMTKPFEIPELIARVNSQIRRYCELNVQDDDSISQDINKTVENANSYYYNENEETTLKVNYEKTIDLKIGELYLNHDSMTFNVNDNNVDLTAYEFKIIELLMKNPDKVFSKDKLYELVWENGYYGEDNTVSVHVSNIRKKISRFTDNEYIKTVWGIGYKLNANVI